jgi:5-formyltetrahydrofolate cyclo-ligase
MMMTDKSPKDLLRAEALARRGKLGVAERAAFSIAITERVIPFAEQMDGGPVGGFWPIRTEIDPRPALKHLSSLGIQAALPVVMPSGLMFRAWNMAEALIEGPFGLSEPDATAPEVSPRALLVPLAAFDRRGHRIGYGAGYYDRAIARLSAIGPLFTIGVAFAVQEIERVPEEAHDRALDVIVTEQETILVKI